MFPEEDIEKTHPENSCGLKEGETVEIEKYNIKEIL